MAGRPRWTAERGTLWVREFGATAASKDAPIPAVTPRIPAVLNEVHVQAAAPLAFAMGLPDSDAVRKRLSTGRRCFAAWVGDEVAAYGWLSHSRECIGELERELNMQPDEVYIWDCATLPKYRQQRLYSALLDCMAHKMREEGVRRVWVGTALANRPSMQGFANAGFREVVRLTYVRLLGLYLVWMTASDGVSAEVAAAARRALIADHEYRWRALAVGRLSSRPRLACAELEA